MIRLEGATTSVRTSGKIGPSVRWLWVTALLVLVFGVVEAERLPIKTYTTADGLAHNSVLRIVRDSRGFLWFCTYEGLSRFDGYNFSSFGTAQGLASPIVNGLLVGYRP